MAPHLEAMRLYGARLAGDEGEDLVQEALIRAWRRWSTFDPAKGEPVAWLLAIVADRARRQRRSRQRSRVLVLMDGHAAAELPAPDVDLERAVARLPRRQRQAVDLYYYLDLDVSTVARVMGCAPGTVRATLHHARDTLRRSLATEVASEHD